LPLKISKFYLPKTSKVVLYYHAYHGGIFTVAMVSGLVDHRITVRYAGNIPAEKSNGQ
jgi:hypothetical protein